jgi:hypothetical protein
MLLVLQQNNLLGEPPTLVEVPDVVGLDQAAAAAALEAEGFVVSYREAYSSTVAVGDVISQDPLAGTEQLEGSVVFITLSLGDEPVSNNKGAGRPKRPRRRMLVEIDGRDFEVSSADEARELLQKARKAAEQIIEKARTTPVRVNRGIQRPRISTKEPELKQVVAQARRDITSLYDEHSRELEIRALMMRAEEEEEEAILRLLM